MEGVEATLHGISRRLRRDNPLPLAAAVIARKDAELESVFLAFFPDVLAFAASTPD